MKCKPKSQQVKRLAKQPIIFRRLTGIPSETFFKLCEKIWPLYYQAEEKRLAKLRLEDRLLMLLMYYRLYITHAFLGFLFQIDDSNMGRNINPLQLLLANLFLDGTEQRIHRPQGPKQKKWYSGKKKSHTIKHQLIVNQKGKIKAVGKSASVSKQTKGSYPHNLVFV